MENPNGYGQLGINDTNLEMLDRSWNFMPKSMSDEGNIFSFL